MAEPLKQTFFAASLKHGVSLASSVALRRCVCQFYPLRSSLFYICVSLFPLLTGKEQFKSHYKETELRPGDDHANFIHAFNAYAPAGTVTGQLAYVNYGRCVVFLLHLREERGG